MNDLAENDRYEQKDGMKARIKKDVNLLLTILNGLDVNASIVVNLNWDNQLRIYSKFHYNLVNTMLGW